MVIIDRTRCGLSCETGAVLFYPYLIFLSAHTDPARSRGIALMVGNLTDVSSLLCGGSHRFRRSHGIALMVGNLTEVSLLLCGAHTDSTQQKNIRENLCG